VSHISEYFAPVAGVGLWDRISLFAFFESIFQRCDLKAALVTTEIPDLRQLMPHLPREIIEQLFAFIRPSAGLARGNVVGSRLPKLPLWTVFPVTGPVEQVK
jgi:hypothetical protein